MSYNPFPNPLPITNESGENLDVEIKDSDGNPVDHVGINSDTLKVSDGDLFCLMTEVLKELKIMNIHLSIMTDVCVDQEEVEV